MNSSNAISWTRLAVFTVIAVILGGLRVYGMTSKSFQAFAHLYTGGFFGAAILGYYHQVGGWKYYAWLGAGLTLLEAVVFFSGLRR